MTPDMLHARGFIVEYPGQIPASFVASAFSREHTIQTDVQSSNHRTLARHRLAPDSGITPVSRFTPDQGNLIYVANTLLLGLMRGAVYSPGDIKQSTYEDKIHEELMPMSQDQSLNLSQAMVKATKSLIIDFDTHYPPLTLALHHELRNVGASGMARGIIEAAKGSKPLHRTRFERIYSYAANAPDLAKVECLGPFIGRQMMVDAKTAIARFSKNAPNALTIKFEENTGTQDDLAQQILGVFLEIYLLKRGVVANKSRE